MADEKKNDLKNYDEGLGVLNVADVLDRFSDTYQDYKQGKIEGKEKDFRETFAQVTGRDDLVDIIMTFSQPVFEDEVENSQEQLVERVEGAIEQYGDNIVSDYVGALGKVIETVKGKVESGEDYQKLPDELKKRALESSVYLNLAAALTDLDVSPEVISEDEELANAVAGLKGIDKVEDSEKRSKGAEYLVKRGFRERNAQHFNIDWDGVWEEHAKPGLRAMYGRIIASKIVDGDYKVDADKFKELYGVADNYKKFATKILMTREQAEAQKKE